MSNLHAWTVALLCLMVLASISFAYLWARAQGEAESLRAALGTAAFQHGLLQAALREAEARGIPNLDAMTQTELQQMCAMLHNLQMYCSHKDFAIGYRLKGEINYARYHEDKADELYRKLPENLRW